jgi:hypothetical protein
MINHLAAACLAIMINHLAADCLAINKPRR